MRSYRVQITEGYPNGLLWSGSAEGDDQAATLAREAFARMYRRLPDHALVTLEHTATSAAGIAHGAVH